MSADAVHVVDPSTDDGWRLYLLLALFDRRDGTPLAEMVQAAREGYERSRPTMAESGAWCEFDRLWMRYTPQQRLQLPAVSGYIETRSIG